MFTLITKISRKDLLLEQAPLFLVSFIIANTFYKFGSFAPELIAFLLTWFALDYAVSFFRKKK